jgi:hypothetical protein
MFRRWIPFLLAGVLGIGAWLTIGAPAHAQGLDPTRFYHYPYYYFPANYWPTMSAPWPEAIGAPYSPPPAYMAYPPFREVGWRYDLFEKMPYYKGAHFWLDQF